MYLRPTILELKRRPTGAKEPTMAWAYDAFKRRGGPPVARLEPLPDGRWVAITAAGDALTFPSIRVAHEELVWFVPVGR